MFVLYLITQADLKQISLVQWGTERGLNTLSELGKLYYSLVWEGTVLLALCSDNDLLPSDSEFGRADLAKLLPKLSSASPKDMDTDSNSSVGVTAAMEGLSTADLAASGLSVPEDEVTSETAGAGGESSTSQAVTGKKAGPTPNTQMKQIRPLLNVSSRWVVLCMFYMNKYTSCMLLTLIYLPCAYIIRVDNTISGDYSVRKKTQIGSFLFDF